MALPGTGEELHCLMLGRGIILRWENEIGIECVSAPGNGVSIDCPCPASATAVPRARAGVLSSMSSLSSGLAGIKPQQSYSTFGELLLPLAMSWGGDGQELGWD